MKLNLGCGENKIAGFINVDIRKEVNPDQVCDIRKLEFVEDSSCETIYASHVLEHFPEWQVRPILYEWKSKLQESGQLILVLPDFEETCKYCGMAFESKQYHKVNRHVGSILGNQDYPQNFHFTLFWDKKIISILKEVGFRAPFCEKKYIDTYYCLYAKGMK